MDHRNGMENYDYDMNQYHDAHPSEPPPMFATYGPDGLPVSHGFAAGPYFGGDLGDGDENDPKRRRIARVLFSVSAFYHLLMLCRPVICAGRRR